MIVDVTSSNNQRDRITCTQGEYPGSQSDFVRIALAVNWLIPVKSWCILKMQSTSLSIRVHQKPLSCKLDLYEKY